MGETVLQLLPEQGPPQGVGDELGCLLELPVVEVLVDRGDEVAGSQTAEEGAPRQVAARYTEPGADEGDDGSPLCGLDGSIKSGAVLGIGVVVEDTLGIQEPVGAAGLLPLDLGVAVGVRVHLRRDEAALKLVACDLDGIGAVEIVVEGAVAAVELGDVRADVVEVESLVLVGDRHAVSDHSLERASACWITVSTASSRLSGG